MEKKTPAILFLIVIIIIITSFRLSSSAEEYLKKPAVCTECHKEFHFNFSRADSTIMEVHDEANLICIDCHSESGIKGFVESRRTLIGALVVKSVIPPFRSTGFNATYPVSFKPLAANCTKCHPGINTTKVVGELRRIDPFSEKILRGPHVNKTCRDCHSENFAPVNCTQCHIPHIKDAGWGYSECVGCHTNPHVPEKNGRYTIDVSRKLCAVCHEREYKIGEVGGGKHGELPCTRCHPVHRTAKNCRDCHGHPAHVFKDETGESKEQCYMCHAKAGCQDCHPPHTPKLYLPRIETNEELYNYAVSVRDSKLVRGR